MSKRVDCVLTCVFDENAMKLYPWSAQVMYIFSDDLWIKEVYMLVFYIEYFFLVHG